MTENLGQVEVDAEEPDDEAIPDFDNCVENLLPGWHLVKVSTWTEGFYQEVEVELHYACHGDH